jgi:alkylation response protein AidB-like acyl-CoA dehydrogenase
VTLLPISDDVDEFRVQVRAWLDEHLVGEFAENLGVGAVDDAVAFELRKRWDKELAAAGLLAITWPVEYGGRGAPLYHEVVLNEELAAARAPYRAGVHGLELFGPTLLMFGSDEQKRHFLPQIAAGDLFWGQGFSEPEAGSDLASLRTRATLDGDEWVIDGQKIWMTMGMHAHWLYALCRTEAGSSRHKGLSLLMIPVDQPGVDVRPITNLAGEVDFAEVFLTGARTAAKNVVGPVGDGWRVGMGALSVERGALMMPSQLRYQQEIEEALDVARQGGVPAGLRDALVDSWIAVRLILENNARTIEEVRQGVEPGPQATTAKLFAAVEHQRMLERAVDALAETGTTAGEDYELHPFQRAFLVSRAATIYGGSAQVQRNLISERLLGMPREPRPA